MISVLTACGSADDSSDKNSDSDKKTTNISTDSDKLNGDTVLVPDLTGCDEESAKMLLINAGLVPVFNECYDDETAYGMVAYTEPAGLTEVTKGTSVAVYVSMGSNYSYAATWTANYIPPFDAKGYNEGTYVNVENVRKVADSLIFNVSFAFTGHDYFDNGVRGDHNSFEFKFPNTATVRIDNQAEIATLTGDCVENYYCNYNAADNTYYAYNMEVSVPLDNIENKYPINIEIDVPISEKQVYTDMLNHNGIMQENFYNHATTIYIHDIVW